MCVDSKKSLLRMQSGMSSRTHMVKSLDFYTFKGVGGWKQRDHRRISAPSFIKRKRHRPREFMSATAN